ncbi:unnamed protein product [Protopolystoma xenopodis]|uniref:Uncharacterized protein n=1 Tax=Protopolystoma xenopodis TaxID=117903 RepID=A0A3S5CQC3_9PLAT|nr:unnamed protein product [Protopolystoma xenopodis]
MRYRRLNESNQAALSHFDRFYILSYGLPIWSATRLALLSPETKVALVNLFFCRPNQSAAATDHHNTEAVSLSERQDFVNEVLGSSLNDSSIEDVSQATKVSRILASKNGLFNTTRRLHRLVAKQLAIRRQEMEASVMKKNDNSLKLDLREVGVPNMKMFSLLRSSFLSDSNLCSEFVRTSTGFYTEHGLLSRDSDRAYTLLSDDSDLSSLNDAEKLHSSSQDSSSSADSSTAFNPISEACGPINDKPIQETPRLPPPGAFRILTKPKGDLSGLPKPECHDGQFG